MSITRIGKKMLSFFAVFFFAAILLPPEFFLLEPPVKERYHRVHDKDGKGNAFRIRAEVTEEHGKKSATDAKDDTSLRAHGRGDIIGCHKDCTEHKTTR